VTRFLIIPFLAFCLGLGTANGSSNDAFTQGLELSRNGQFPEAADAFALAARTHPASGTFVNLGLAEWQRGRAGAAILAWEQALWIDPYDARAKANLNFARDVAQVDPPQLKWEESVSLWLRPNAWMWLSALTFWFAVAMLVLPRVFRLRKSGWQQWLAALAFGIFLFSLAGNFGIVSRTHTGFIVKRNAPLLLTPTHDAEVISTLAAGEPVREVRTRGEFVLVRTLTGLGWLDKDAFGRLCPR